jgi:hypothetical protein
MVLSSIEVARDSKDTVDFWREGSRGQTGGVGGSSAIFARADQTPGVMNPAAGECSATDLVGGGGGLDRVSSVVLVGPAAYEAVPPLGLGAFIFDLDPSAQRGRGIQIRTVEDSSRGGSESGFACLPSRAGRTLFALAQVHGSTVGSMNRDSLLEHRSSKWSSLEPTEQSMAKGGVATSSVKERGHALDRGRPSSMSDGRAELRTKSQRSATKRSISSSSIHLRTTQPYHERPW